LQRPTTGIGSLRRDARRQIGASRAGALACGGPLQTLRCHDAVDGVQKAALDALSIGTVSVPIAIGLLLLMFPC
jgi:hypothetical protein